MFNYSYLVALTIIYYAYYILDELLANPSNKDKYPPAYYHDASYGIFLAGGFE